MRDSLHRHHRNVRSSDITKWMLIAAADGPATLTVDIAVYTNENEPTDGAPRSFDLSRHGWTSSAAEFAAGGMHSDGNLGAASLHLAWFAYPHEVVATAGTWELQFPGHQPWGQTFEYTPAGGMGHMPGLLGVPGIDSGEASVTALAASALPFDSVSVWTLSSKNPELPAIRQLTAPPCLVDLLRC